MRDTSDSRTLPLSLGKPARKRVGQSGAAFLPPLSPAAAQEREFQRERIARRERELELVLRDPLVRVCPAASMPCEDYVRPGFERDEFRAIAAPALVPAGSARFEPFRFADGGYDMGTARRA